jgi:hypothetical protein
MRKIWLFAIYLFSMVPLFAQSISGSSSVLVGSTNEYSFFDDRLYSNPYWDTSSGGLITSVWTSGATFYANITWSTPGTYVVSFYDGETQLAQMNVDVSGCIAGPPSTGFTYTSNATYTIITRTADPPAGEQWFWQGNQALTQNTFSYAYSGGVELKARDINSGCVSAPTTTASLPAQPGIGGATRCGAGGVTLTASGASGFQWYLASSGGASVGSGPTYSPSVSATTTFWVCSYDAATGAVSPRSPVVATVDPFSVGGSVAGSTSYCGSASGTLTLSGHTGAVQRWEQNVNDAGWTNINNTATSLSYSNVTSSTQYRAMVVSGTCGGQYSSIATVTVSPTSQGGNISGAGTFCSTASGTFTLSGHTGAVQRWEQNVNDAGWTNINNTTATQGYSNLTAANTQYRAWVVSGTCAGAYSSVAIVSVSPNTVGGAISGAGTFCSSASGWLTLSGHTGSVVQWEQNVNSGGWTGIGNTTASLNYINVTATTQYRAWVVSGPCSGQYSSIATVTVSPTSQGGIISGAGSFCSTASGTFTLSGHTGAVQRWEQNVNDAGWTNINNTTATQGYSNLTAATTQYRAWVVSGTCAGAYSSVAIVSVSPNTVGGAISGTGTFCSSASGWLTLSGHTGAVQRWEQNVNNAGWTNIANTTASQNYNNVTITTQYRAYVVSGVCGGTYSSITTVAISPTSVGGTITGGSTNESYCKPASGTFILTGHVGNVLRWEQNFNQGAGWQAIANTASATYNFSNVNQLVSYRAIVKSGVCAEVASSIKYISFLYDPTLGGSLNVTNRYVYAVTATGTLNISGNNGDRCTTTHLL